MNVNKRIQNYVPLPIKDFELVIASPLTRALTTTELLFANTELTSNRLALPLATERVYLSSDVGRKKEVLMKEFPHWYIYCRY